MVARATCSILLHATTAEYWAASCYIMSLADYLVDSIICPIGREIIAHRKSQLMRLRTGRVGKTCEAPYFLFPNHCVVGWETWKAEELRERASNNVKSGLRPPSSASYGILHTIIELIQTFTTNHAAEEMNVYLSIRYNISGAKQTSRLAEVNFGYWKSGTKQTDETKMKRNNISVGSYSTVQYDDDRPLQTKSRYHHHHHHHHHHSSTIAPTILQTCALW